jgi:hypothetical protein
MAMLFGEARRLRGRLFDTAWCRIGGLCYLCRTASRQGRPDMLPERRCHCFRDVGRPDIGFDGIGFGGVGFRYIRLDSVACVDRSFCARWRLR